MRAEIAVWLGQEEASAWRTEEKIASANVARVISAVEQASYAAGIRGVLRDGASPVTWERDGGRIRITIPFIAEWSETY